MRVYISGPITGLPEAESRNLFRLAADAIRACGHEPVNPWDIDADGLLRDYASASYRLPYELTPTERWYVFMTTDLELLRTCEHLVHTQGYKNSRGAMTEHYYALGLGIPVSNSIKDFIRACGSPTQPTAQPDHADTEQRSDAKNH